MARSWLLLKVATIQTNLTLISKYRVSSSTVGIYILSAKSFVDISTVSVNSCNVVSRLSMLIVAGYYLRRLTDVNANAPSVSCKDLTEPGHILKVLQLVARKT